MRRGNDLFRDAATKSLRDVMRSGHFKTLYDRWFTSPVPPDGINLDLPMGADLVRKVGGG